MLWTKFGRDFRTMFQTFALKKITKFLRGVLWRTSELYSEVFARLVQTSNEESSEELLKTSEELVIFSKSSRVFRSSSEDPQRILWRNFWTFVQACPHRNRGDFRSIQRSFEVPLKIEKISSECDKSSSELFESIRNSSEEFRSSSEAPLKKLHVLM